MHVKVERVRVMTYGEEYNTTTRHAREHFIMV